MQVGVNYKSTNLVAPLTMSTTYSLPGGFTSTPKQVGCRRGSSGELWKGSQHTTYRYGTTDA